MRKLLAMLGLAAAVIITPRHARADDDDWNDEAQQQQSQQVNPEVFEQNLQPYGQWEYDNSYGQVFYPSVAAGWRPYTYGRWVWTDYGWMWVSQEPFGWATYHYGRWWWNPWRHAWGWVPGYEWSPAWVVWRFGSTAIGWAPLYVGYDTWVDDYPVYYDHWVYVPCDHFYGGEVYTYVYAPTYVRTVYYNTHPAVGYVGTTSYGPPTTFVAAHSATPITTTPVYHAPSPAQATAGHGYNGGAVAVYTPPQTKAYNPSQPSSPAYRGPGASRTPVVAPPTVTSRAPSFVGGGQQPGRGPGVAPSQGRGNNLNAGPGTQPGRGPNVAPSPGYGQGRGNPNFGGQQPSTSPSYGGSGPSQRPSPGYGNRPGQPSFPGQGQPGQQPSGRPQQRPQGPQQPVPSSPRPGRAPPPNFQGSNQGSDQQGYYPNNPSYTPRRRPDQYAFPNQPVRGGNGPVYQTASNGYRANPAPTGYSGGYRPSGGGFSGGGYRPSAPQPSFSAPQHRSSGGSSAPAPARGNARHR